MNKPSLERDHLSLSSLFNLTLIEYNNLNRRHTHLLITSCSSKAYVPLIRATKHSKWAAIEASFAQGILYKSEKGSLRALPPQHK
jgi:hypothetical protein